MLILTIFCTLSGHAAVPDSDVVIKAIEQAEELQLAQHDVWLALLHYKQETVLRRFISQVDDERFFLDKKGKTDPQAELIADIAAFLRVSEQVHAQCLFPARWWWLKQQLNLPDEYDVSCPKLDAFKHSFSRQKLFLVFPAMYLNNPGSTFGHTFLRFDGNDESIFLSQTLNYAARVDRSDNLVSYISKGLFGGYKGFFQTRPYSETVQEYSNIENRDIWEYQLDFTAEEIEQLVRHVWEVKGIDFDYYFFRENCSYRLLALIDVMRPDLQLTGKNDFPVYAIPVDTVRALDEKDLILSRSFRASLVTQIDNYFAEKDDRHSDVVLKIVSSETTADGDVIGRQLEVISLETEKRLVLEQSYDILQFSGESDSAKAQQILQLLNALPATQQVEETAMHTLNVSPEKGHDSIRASVGYGEQNSRQYIDLRFRPAFHDLLDAPQGYVDGAAINIFDTRLKWFINNDSSDSLRLESLSLFNVASLNPVRRWQNPISWMLDFRFDRTQLSESQSVRNFISQGGLGASFKLQAFTPYALLMGEWQLASAYDKGYSLLLGVQAGIRYQLRSSQFLASYEINDAVAGFELDRKITNLQWQYNLQVNHAIRALYRRTQYDFFNDEDWTLDYNYYF